MKRRTLVAKFAAVLAMPKFAAVLAIPTCAAVLAMCVPVLTMPAAAALAATGPAVTVRVEGLKRTLLAPEVVRVHGGWITRYGAPKGGCPANSAQGALDVTTRHRWVGKWSTQFGPEYAITSILGESHSFSSRYYWSVFVDNGFASAGACELKLHRGEQLLFAAVPQTGFPYATTLRAPRTASVGHPFTVKVMWFKGGKAKPLAGASVTGSGVSATTNRNGVATLSPSHPGRLILRAEHAWSASAAYVRAAPVTVHVS